ncbi:hypothetical protein [Wenjunlia vitaminophila]|uniref:hypothetical protein n=1 Tax=Wenjunlia vitaminophila TaxID=76728 RepID=UPI001F36EC1D|nr:hypothetical protein [Wenjunlia vitaminophila]
MLELVGHQHCIRCRIGSTIGDVDAGVTDQMLEQQLPDHTERPLDGGLVGRPPHPRGQDLVAEHPLDSDQVMVAIDRSVVGGHRLRSEERQVGHRVPGELGYHRGRQARVGPFQVLAPVRPHRQRHRHIPQHHRDVRRGVGDQRQPESDQRVRADVQGQGEVHLHRIAEHMLADHHRQHRGVQRDDLARPVRQDVPPTPGRSADLA